MAGQYSEKAPVTFCDVVASFSMEEWRLLHDWQKELYKNVMSEIQKALISLGPLIAASVFSLSTEEKEVFLPVDSAGSEACDRVYHPSGDVNFESHLPSELSGDKTYCLQKQQDTCQWESSNNTSRVEHKDSSPISSFTVKEEVDAECLDHLDFQEGEKLVNPAEDGASLKKEGGNTLKYDMIQPSGASQKIEHMYVLQRSTERINIGNKPQFKANPLFDGEDTMQFESGIGEQTFSDFYHPGMPNVTISSEFNESENVISNRTLLSCQQSANLIKPWHACTECDKGFSKRSNLLRHQRRHFGANLYQCRDCKKSFSLKEHLILHQRTHTEDRLYHCSSCKLHFSQQEQLVAHQRMHERERPYECTKCEKRFRHKFSLTLHERTHTGEKPYQCNICRKSFSQTSHLITHRRTHTGEKPFQCLKCKKSFGQKVNLIRHENAHACCTKKNPTLEPFHEVDRPGIY